MDRDINAASVARRIRCFPPSFFDTPLKFSPEKSDFFSPRLFPLLLFDSHRARCAVVLGRDAEGETRAKSERAMLYYNNFLSRKWVYMETADGLNPRRKILRTAVGFSRPLRGNARVRACTKWRNRNFSLSAMADFTDAARETRDDDFSTSISVTIVF